MTTTIKVSVQTRDRLKQQAATAQMSLGRYVEVLSLQAARKERLAAVREAAAGMSANEHASYESETAAWEATELTDAQ